jgi:hypothetical protein
VFDHVELLFVCLVNKKSPPGGRAGSALISILQGVSISGKPGYLSIRREDRLGRRERRERLAGFIMVASLSRGGASVNAQKG